MITFAHSVQNGWEGLAIAALCTAVVWTTSVVLFKNPLLFGLHRRVVLKLNAENKPRGPIRWGLATADYLMTCRLCQNFWSAIALCLLSGLAIEDWLLTGFMYAFGGVLYDRLLAVSANEPAISPPIGSRRPCGGCGGK